MQALAIQPAGQYVDATFGRGGHTRALLARLNAEGRVWAADRDPQAIAAAQTIKDSRLTLWRASFTELLEQLKAAALAGKLHGMLFDLGVSSPQLDQPERGFSFAADGPLDMRMDPDSGESAADWLARATPEQIADVLHHFGEERYARRIARAIVETRTQQPLRTTKALADLIAAAIPTREPGKHPATRTFQALRIHINNELNQLRTALAAVCELLAPGGRLVVISFHSLEDRIVKHFIREQSRGLALPKRLPVPAATTQGQLRAIGGLIRPGAAEIAANPRARSARLRTAERL